MDSQQFYRGRLHEHLDEHGDLAPPWEQFPHYERYTIGWRMGAGEGWLSYWHVFLDSLCPGLEVRFAYLKRHPPAPICWADHVYRVLHPATQRETDDDGVTEARHRDELLRMELIVSDAAYPIWLRQQHGVRWPWEMSDELLTVARHWTRDLWFWSRQIAELRREPVWVLPEVPPDWQACAAPLGTGKLPDIDLRQGLLSLTQMLCAGRVVPPWELGLTPADFADSFEIDMGYADAFRLWLMAAFDDREHMQRTLGREPPANWQQWMVDQFHLA